MSRASDKPSLNIGTAGWNIPAPWRGQFPQDGSHLQRYARVLPAVEINSSFYRPHRLSTYVRWAEETPSAFRFSVKAPKSITHERRLQNCEALWDRFVEEVAGLQDRLGVILIQLPPSLACDHDVAVRFFEHIGTSGVPIACEPRHVTWFQAEANELLTSMRVARVAADPSIVPSAAQPGGWPGLRYWRLHGSPVMYASSYGPDSLRRLEQQLLDAAAACDSCWCIFDNTKFGAATENALELQSRMTPPMP